MEKEKNNTPITISNGKAEEENLSSKEILERLEKSKKLMGKIKGEV